MLLRVGLESQNKDRLGIRSSHQAPAVFEQNASAIDRDHLVSLGKVRRDRRDDLKFVFVGTMNTKLRCRKSRRNVGEQLGQRLVGPGKYLENACTGVSRIIKTVEAVSEKYMPAHLAGKGRAG